MNNIKKALTLKRNKDIEEHAILPTEGSIVNCFISYCPHEIEEGKNHDVELTINLSSSYKVEKAEKTTTPPQPNSVNT